MSCATTKFSFMGKRKSTARKPVKKVKQTLDLSFTCLFCNHEKSVICTLDKKNGIGELHCKICGQSFQTAVHSLSKPVDIYSDWIDACEDLEEQAVELGVIGDVEEGNMDEDEGDDGGLDSEDDY